MRHGQKVDPDRVRALHAAGWDDAAIADELGVGRSTAWRWRAVNLRLPPNATPASAAATGGAASWACRAGRPETYARPRDRGGRFAKRGGA